MVFGVVMSAATKSICHHKMSTTWVEPIKECTPPVTGFTFFDVTQQDLDEKTNGLIPTHFATTISENTQQYLKTKNYHLSFGREISMNVQVKAQMVTCVGGRRPFGAQPVAAKSLFPVSRGTAFIQHQIRIVMSCNRGLVMQLHIADSNGDEVWELAGRLCFSQLWPVHGGGNVLEQTVHHRVNPQVAQRLHRVDIQQKFEMVVQLQTAAVCLSSNCLGTINDHGMRSVVQQMKAVRSRHAHLQSISDESLEWMGVLMLGLGMKAGDVPMIPTTALPQEWIAVWGHWERGMRVYQTMCEDMNLPDCDGKRWHIWSCLSKLSRSIWHCGKGLLFYLLEQSGTF